AGVTGADLVVQLVAILACGTGGVLAAVALWSMPRRHCCLRGRRPVARRSFVPVVPGRWGQ
ncbi:hypothetical protein ACWEK5_22790, partial [Rhodococcus koreensis]